MNYAKMSSVVSARAPSPQSTLISTNTTNTAHQTPSTDNSAGQLPVVIPAYQQRPDYSPQDCVNVSPTTLFHRHVYLSREL